MKRTLFCLVLTFCLSDVPAQDYALEILAETGSGLSSIDFQCAINDEGHIAFTGRDQAGSKAFLASGPGAWRALTAASSRRVYQGIAINDDTIPEVAFRERVSGVPIHFLVRRFPTKTGKTASIIGSTTRRDFDSASFHMDMNDSGVVVFSALVNGSRNTALMAGTQTPPTRLAVYTSRSSLRPQISNTNRIVIQDNLGRIIVWPYPSGSPEVVAPSTWTKTGPAPGISKDGRAVALMGDRGNKEAIFVSFLYRNTRTLIPVSGEGKGPFSDFDDFQRVGVFSVGSADVFQRMRVVFAATANGKPGIYSIDVDAYDSNGALKVDLEEPRLVAEVGGKIAGKTVTSLQIYHPINNLGEIGFWAQLGSSQAVVRALPLKIEVLDGADFVSLFSSRVTADKDRLAENENEEKRVGTAADGLSRLLIRVTAPGEGKVTLLFDDDKATPDEGEIAAPQGAFGNTPVEVSTQVTTKGHQAFFVYRAPNEFVRKNNSEDPKAAEREVLLRLRFTPKGAGVWTSDVDQVIEIRRPAVVLAHGLWSASNTWRGKFAKLGDDPRFDVRRFDYSRSANAAFRDNAPEIYFEVILANALLHEQGFASTRVDWVGHSMGAVLPRVYYRMGTDGSGVPWKRFDNYGEGDIHKLITINSPQWGSPFGNLLTEARKDPTCRQVIDELLEDQNKPFGRAVTDLGVGSPAMRDIGPTPIPSHAIVGLGTRALLHTLGIHDKNIRELHRVIPNIGPLTEVRTFVRTLGACLNVSSSQLFQNDEHDGIVSATSQTAGLSGNALSILGAVTMFHTEVTNGDNYGMRFYDRVVELLNSRVEERFRHLGAPRLLGESAGGSSSGILVGGVRFTSPATTPVKPGQTITATVVGALGFTPASVDIFSNSETKIARTAPFTVTLKVPDDAVGSISLFAFGVDANDKSAFSGILRIPVTVDAKLQALRPVESHVPLAAPQQRRFLTVLGDYDDKVVRDVTRSATGTTYASANPAIVAVSKDGVLEAVRPGKTTIRITNGSLSVEVSAEVRLPVVVAYGLGTAGKGGFVPRQAASGVPQIGNQSFGVVADRVVGGAPGIGLVGVAPAKLPVAGGTLLVDLVATLTLPVVANGSFGQAGVGVARVPLPLPNDPALVGVAIFSQSGFFDGAAPGGWSFTNGLATTLQR